MKIFIVLSITITSFVFSGQMHAREADGCHESFGYLDFLNVNISLVFDESQESVSYAHVAKKISYCKKEEEYFCFRGDGWFSFAVPKNKDLFVGDNWVFDDTKFAVVDIVSKEIIGRYDGSVVIESDQGIGEVLRFLYSRNFGLISIAIGKYGGSHQVSEDVIYESVFVSDGYGFGCKKIDEIKSNDTLH